LALIRDIKMLAHQIGAELRIFSEPNEAGKLQPLIEKALPGCRLSIVQADTWEKVQRILFAEIKPDDMTLLPVDRRSGILWTPTLDHLPEMIAERFPEMNLLVAYPSLATLDQATGDHIIE
jgi:hypothetical protein